MNGCENITFAFARKKNEEKMNSRSIEDRQKRLAKLNESIDSMDDRYIERVEYKIERALLYRTFKQIEKALSDLEDVVHYKHPILPDSWIEDLPDLKAKAYSHLAEIYFQENDLVNALLNITEALKLDSRNREYQKTCHRYLMIGYFKENPNNRKVIDEHAAGTIGGREPSAESSYYRSMIDEARNDLWSALTHANNAIKNEDKADYFFLRARIHEGLGYSDKARSDVLSGILLGKTNRTTVKYTHASMWKKDPKADTDANGNEKKEEKHSPRLGKTKTD